MPSRTVEANVEEFTKLDGEIVVGEADLEAKKWRQAELAAEAVESGIAKKEYARRVGKSPVHIRRLVHLWTTHGGTSGSPLPVFAKAYGELKEEPDEAGRGASVAKRVAREQPETFVAAFEQAPPEVRQQIAHQISRAPEVRAEARQRDVEAEEQRQPSPVKPRGDHLVYQFESRLSSAEASLRQALEILGEVDQPGNNEDTLDKIGRLRSLVNVIEEAYRTGKSLETWAAELYEREAG